VRATPFIKTILNRFDSAQFAREILLS
jgi:hypothetical protein